MDIKEIMEDGISKLALNASHIAGPEARANAYYQLVLACARALEVSGKDNLVISDEEQETEEPVKQEQKPVIGLQGQSVQEEIPEQTVNKQEEVPELPESWTPQAQEILAKEMETFNEIINLTEKNNFSIERWIEEATDGAIDSLDDITPRNLKLIIQYIQGLDEYKDIKGE